MDDETNIGAAILFAAFLIANVISTKLLTEKATAEKACLKYEPTLTKPQHEKCKEDLLRGLEND